MAHVNSGMDECCGVAKPCLSQCSTLPVIHCSLPGNVLATFRVTAVQSPWNKMTACKHTALEIFESHFGCPSPGDEIFWFSACFVIL
jgi:hypothetical protein